jgi:rhodanese-like protein
MRAVPLSRALVPLATAAVAAFAPGCHRAGSSEPFGSLEVGQVERLVRTGAASTFDANGPETYAAGHVPGAVLVANGEVDPKILPSDKDRHLVFYCMNPH